MSFVVIPPLKRAYIVEFGQQTKINFKDTNIILSGGVDDIWIDTKTNELIIDSQIIEKARKSVERMAEIGR